MEPSAKRSWTGRGARRAADQCDPDRPACPGGSRRAARSREGGRLPARRPAHRRGGRGDLRRRTAGPDRPGARRLRGHRAPRRRRPGGGHRDAERLGAGAQRPGQCGRQRDVARRAAWGYHPGADQRGPDDPRHGRPVRPGSHRRREPAPGGAVRRQRRGAAGRPGGPGRRIARRRSPRRRAARLAGRRGPETRGRGRRGAGRRNAGRLAAWAMWRRRAAAGGWPLGSWPPVAWLPVAWPPAGWPPAGWPARARAQDPAVPRYSSPEGSRHG